jgi:hypothetical protein
MSHQLLDQLQAKVEAAVCEHNATGDPRKMHVVWGHRDKETEGRRKQYEGTDDEVRQALLNFDGADFEVYLFVGRDGRPGWMSVCNYLEDVLPLPHDPEGVVDVLRGSVPPAVRVDLFPGTGEDEGLVLAGSVSAEVFVDGLTALVLRTLLEDLSTSADLVHRRLADEDTGSPPLKTLTRGQAEELAAALHEALNPREEGGQFTRDCECDHARVRAALTDMGLTYEQIEAAVEELDGLGGHCDCEVMFNVLGREEDDEDDGEDDADGE